MRRPRMVLIAAHQIAAHQPRRSRSSPGRMVSGCEVDELRVGRPGRADGKGI